MRQLLAKIDIIGWLSSLLILCSKYCNLPFVEHFRQLILLRKYVIVAPLLSLYDG